MSESRNNKTDLRGSNAYARGVALEYVNGVLPGSLRVKLEPIVAGMGGRVASR